MMDIVPIKITIRDLVKGYEDNDDRGVFAHDGKLNVRPAYQREFIYKDKQRDLVIDTVTKGFPLNIMYWSDQSDGTFEIIDGQQRTISICQYVTGVFSINGMAFHNLEKSRPKEAAKILNYELTVYKCSGDLGEKLDWFEVINIAGIELSKQELRNAVYSGPWVTAAKQKFSKNGCLAYNIASDYLSGSCLRQDYLATAIKWIANCKTDSDIRDYMSDHHHDQNANELLLHFEKVIGWIECTFIEKRPKFMKSTNWGELYDNYKDQTVDTQALEKEIAKLFANDEIEKKSGIYTYVLTREEKHLNLRPFSDSMKQKVYEKQHKRCKKCRIPKYIDEMEADHIDPWSKGGKTVEKNCQMLCRPCNRRKSDK